jgi:hypothetical protein
MPVQKIKSGRVNISIDSFVGDNGVIFFDESDGLLRLGDGETPGGLVLAGGGGDGSGYVLPVATTTRLGGVKIDNSTIAINNQVISVLNGVFTTSSYANPSWITSLAYNKLSGAPILSTVATSGSYNDLSNRPSLFSGNYNDLTNRPTLFSGSYTDLSNRPTIPTSTNQLTNDAGFITSTALTGLATEEFVNSAISNIEISDPYVLPTASTTTLGGIKLGQGLTIDGEGVVSVVGGGGEGIPGADGEDGASAYEIAVANGFDGTEQQWLTSLIGSAGADGAPGEQGPPGADGVNGIDGAPGADGAPGRDGIDGINGIDGAPGEQGPPGADGINGADGASAYEIAVANGFNGTEQEWLASLEADPAQTGNIRFENSVITTVDSSGIVFETASIFNSDITVENDLVVNGEIRNTFDELFATQNYVVSEINKLIDTAPDLLNTLSEIAAALNNDESFATTITGQLALKADTEDLATVAFSGSYNDLTDAPTVINANGTLSLPILIVEPTNLQAGQIALADGVQWDPLAKNESRPYLAIYTGSGWIDVGGLTTTDVYKQILEIG